MKIVMGVDSSTQSCKVELRDLETGGILGRGSASHPPAFAPRSEQNPQDWWEAFERALNRAVETAAIDRTAIVAISVAAQCHGLIALDEQDRVIRPAKLWNDTESAPQLARLREAIGAENWIRKVGSLPTAAFTIGKIAWLAENEPENFRAMRRICLPHDWLTYRLCGVHVTDRSEASGTGYWSATENRYVTTYLDLIAADRDWASMLPRVLGPDEAAGTILPDIADRLGLSRDILIGPGGGDQHAAALGLAVEEGDAVYTIATSGVIFTTASRPVHDLSGLVDGVADCAGGYLPLVSTLNAARVTDWAARLLDVDHAGLSKLALEADPLASPVFAAFLDGERKPNRPDSYGLMGGLTAATSRADLARAAHDGVLLALIRGETIMNQAGIATDGRVIITGGGARSSAYRQILADYTQRRVMIADPAEADESTARGAAIQAAAIATGRDLQTMRQLWAPRYETVAEPNRAMADSRTRLLDRYLALSAWSGFDGRMRS